MTAYASSQELYLAIQQYKEVLSSLPEPDLFREQIILKANHTVLDELMTCFDSAQNMNKEQAIAFLASHWQRIKDTLLSYTAQPETELTGFLISVAQLLSDENNLAISYLMPGIGLEAISDKYTDEDGLSQLATLSLQQVLRTHITGQGDYLIPLASLIDCEHARLNNTIAGSTNPYYDFASHPAHQARISAQEEYPRLMGHSAETQALHEATTAVMECEREQLDLLSQLNKLCRALHTNDAHGLGQHARAGEGVYVAIVAFGQYFEKLPTEESSKIPERVLNEIHTLLRLSATTNAYNQSESCIATRKVKLLEAINVNDTKQKLAEITLNPETEIRQLQGQLQQAEVMLQQRLSDNTYTGRDHLGINVSLLQWLNLRLNITSRHDIYLFMQNSLEDMTQLISFAPHIVQELAIQIPNVEALILFLITLALN